METTGFKRIFTNNDEYKDYEGVLFIDSLAYTMQEYLYTSKAKGEDHDYRMDKHIKLYDFMNVVVSFVKSLNTDFCRTTLKDYIEEIRKNTLSLYDKELLEYKYDILIISHASDELVMALLWAPYVYAYTFQRITNSESWEKTTLMLYDVLQGYSSYPEKQFRIHPLMALTFEAAQVMIDHILTNHAIDSEEIDDDADEKEQIMEHVKEDIPVRDEVENDIVEEISLHDKVRLDLLLRLIKSDGANIDKHGNKTKAAQLMQSITGLPLQTCKNYCSDPNLNTSTHSEEVLKMNTLLQAIDMKIRL